MGTPDAREWTVEPSTQELGALFEFAVPPAAPFELHSGDLSRILINCNAFTEHELSALAALVASHALWRDVYGIPRGGQRFARALDQFSLAWREDLPVLIVDDVFTTGASMADARDSLGDNSIGVVLFDRSVDGAPGWITPVFTLNRTIVDTRVF